MNVESVNMVVDCSKKNAPNVIMEVMWDTTDLVIVIVLILLVMKPPSVVAEQLVAMES